MQVIHEAEAQVFQNSQACSAYEYCMQENEINGAVVKLNGRYPDIGCVTNLKCKELVYILRGTGKLVVDGNEVLLSEGDMVLIIPNEEYFWEGRMTLLTASNPAWTFEQHRHIP
jgi:mannose-6-phosphate isomerase-like protein (cupin superfamily)